MPLLLAGDKHRNLRGCDLSGVFMPRVLIVFLLLMQTLSIITFSSDWKLRALLNKNTAKEWNVYPLRPHYKAFRNQTIRPNTVALNYMTLALLSNVWTLCQRYWVPSDDHVIGRKCYYSCSTLWAPLAAWLLWRLLPQILSVEDVKPESTVWFRSKQMGPCWESWLVYRHYCLPGASTFISPWHYVIVLMPHLPPRVWLGKREKRLLLWGPTAWWALPLVLVPGMGQEKHPSQFPFLNTR